MRHKRLGRNLKIWFSESDTYDWAHKPGAAWPCSALSDKKVFVEFHDGDLVDIQINGGRGDRDCGGHELNAMVDDALNAHPKW